MPVRETVSDPGDERPATEPGRLLADLTEPASDFSPWLSVRESAVDEARGLSVLRAPGIFERMEPRNERRDSLVSDFEKDGYDCNVSPLALPLECD